MQASGAGSVIPLTNARDEAIRLVSASRAAGHDWNRRPLATRLEVIARFRARLAADADALAATIGKRPALETLTGEVLPVLEACRFLERNAARILRRRRVTGRVGAWLAGTRLELRREPFGTVLIIAPSNYAFMLPAIQALQAVTAGNSVLIKPAPGSAPVLERFTEWMAASGLPSGVLRIIDESIDASSPLLDGLVDKLIFTGSSETGRRVLRQAATHLVPATVELSGWDACIVLDSADMERTARAIAFGLTFNNGETCMAPRRILVSPRRGAELVRRLAGLLEKAAPASFGARAAQDARSLVADAIARGASLATGRVDTTEVSGPILVTGVDESMPIFSTEIFGPIAVVTQVGDPAAAIAHADATPFGLGASIFGDVAEARALAAELEAGVVMINDVVVGAAHPALTIAARKSSGFGATRGAEGLLGLTRPKTLVCNRSRRPLHLAPQSPGDRDLIAAWIHAAYGHGFLQRCRALRRAIAAGRKRIFTEKTS